MYRNQIKSGLDVFAAGILLCIFLIPSLLISVFLLFHLKGRIFFIQQRVGYKGEVFKLIKFRTMRETEAGNNVPDSERITWAGKFLRHFSIDEIPQLINVLKGEMSLVGPRPLPEEYLPLYNSEQAKRHLVKPGITGLVQVKGRNSLSWNKKFELDIFYVKHISFLLDLKIIVLTIARVLLPANPEVRIPEKFKGSFETNA